MVAEFRLLEEAGQPLDRCDACGQSEQEALQVLGRRLTRLPAQAVPAEDAFHPGVRRDDGAARVRLGLEIVDCSVSEKATSSSSVNDARPTRGSGGCSSATRPTSHAGEQEGDRRPETGHWNVGEYGAAPFPFFPLPAAR